MWSAVPWSRLLLVLLLTACGAPAVAPTVTPTVAPAQAAARSDTPTPAATATATLAPATATSVPTATPQPPTATSVPPTATPLPPTATPKPPTPKPQPPTATPEPEAPTPTPRPAAAMPTHPPTPLPATATPAGAPAQPPANPPRAAREIVRGSTTVPAIALTFDAGAGAAPTADILAALSARGLRATFFLTGKWVDENPGLAQQIAAAGHEIANHSYNHPDFTKLSHGEMIEEINSTERTIQRVTGQSSRPWFRFPYGARNAGTLGVVADLEYVSVYWTLDSLDSVGAPKTPQFLYERVTGNVGNGSIVLMHIGSAPTAAALPRIIDTLLERGYQLVTVSELVS